MGEDSSEPQSIPGALGCGCWYGVVGGSCTVGGIMEEWLYNAANGRFNWRPIKMGLGWLLYFALVGAAIYELIEW